MNDGPRVITDRRQVDPAWLTQTLRAADLLDRGQVTAVAVEVWKTKPVSDLLRLRVTYSRPAPRSAPTSFILKVTRPTAAAVIAARRGWKEHQFYAAVAAAMDEPPVPRCYDAVYDPDLGRAHLLLEDLSASHDRPPHPFPPTARQAEQDVDCLARIHARWWNDPEAVAGVSARDEGWYVRRVAHLDDLFARFVDELGDVLAPATRTALARVVAFHPTLLRRQAAANLTVAHGDAHCWNFLNPDDPGDERAVLIDWECWDLEPGTNDLALLIALHWFPDLRAERERPLLARYHRALERWGVTGYPWDQCWDDYRYSVLQRLLNPIYQWHRGREPVSWWTNLARIAAAYHDLGCAELIG